MMNCTLIKNHKNTSFVKTKLLFLFAFTLFYTATINSQCVNPIDCDGDGIANISDLDDDNDGILDSDECNQSSSLQIISDNDWMASTTISPSLGSGNWAGIASANLPGASTYTLPTVIGNSVITAVPGSQEMLSGNNIRFYRYTFNITDGSIVNSASFEATVDNSIQIFVNGISTALESSLVVSNFYLPANTVIINAIGANINGNGAENFDQITSLKTNDIFKSGQNEIILAVRNLGGGDAGGWSFKGVLDISYCDTDNDGIANSLDTDSDNDGCPDAIEASGLYSAAQVSNTLVGGSNGGSLLNFPTPINNKGIPTAVGTTVGGNETNGQVTSAKVTTAEEISISVPPTNTTVNENDNANFSVTASSISTTTFNAGSPDYTIPSGTNTTAALSYKWFKNSAPATSLSSTNTLTLNTVTFTDAGDYTLVITSVDNNCPEERTITLTVNGLPTATDDTAAVNENSPANTIDVLNNDSFGNDGPNTGTISLPNLTSTNGGTLSVDDGGTPNTPIDDTILYTPLLGFIGNDTFNYFITDADGNTSLATAEITVNTVYNCADSPTAPAQGFNVFVEENMAVISTETKGAVAVGENLSIKGDYNVATDDCGDFDTNGLKTGLLVGGRVNYPLNTVINTSDDDCNCGDPTIVNNGSFEQNVSTNSWTLKNESDIPGWYTTATDNKIEIWKSGFQGKNAQDGNFIAEINANQRAALYQVICAEPGSVLDWSIWHRGRRGIDVANVKVGVSLNSAGIVETMSTDQNAWQNYTGSYTVPAGEYTVYFVFESVSSQPYNNLSYGNLIDNFEVTKTLQGTCPAGAGTNNGLLTVVNPNYYTKIGDSNGSVAWYFDELGAPAPMRVTPNGTYNSSSRIQMNSSSSAYGVSSASNAVYENNLIDFSSAFQSLRTNSTNLALNTDNSVLEDNAGNSITNTTLTNHTEIFLNNGVNYLNITGSDLNATSIFEAQRNANSDRILIINVDAPGTFNWNVWEQRGFAPGDSPYVLYNFQNTTELNIVGSEEIYGTVFAPFADIKKSINKEDIYGQVIAKSFIHDGGVIHCQKFAAATTCPPIVGIIPTSDFNVNINPQCSVQNIFTFDNLTNTGGTIQPDAPITYLWSFGDGTTSTEMSPTKTYALPGTYTVSLTSTNKFGSNTTTMPLIVLPVLEPIVSVVTLPSGSGTVKRQFTIDNAASFTSFSWTLPGIGPGSGPGLLQNTNPIVHEFSTAGIFTVSVTATSNDCTITIDVPVVITSSEVSTGNSGGVESESLGDAISKIYVGRKKNSVPTNFVKSSENVYNKIKMKSSQAYQGKGQTLLDMFPSELVAGNLANITSPTDILDYTIADEVLSVDFSINGKTKGVVLGIKTSDKIYNHTKASCDRLRGAEILKVVPVKLKGYDFLMQAIKQRNGIVEYAISFATAKNNNDNNYTIQTNWYVNNYIKFNDVYNFQVWSTNPEDTQKLVVDVLKNLNTFMPVAQTELQKVPQTYAAKISRDKGELVILMRSTEKGLNTELSMEELYSETANNVKYRYNPVNTQLEQTLRVDIKDGYEYDALIKVNGQVADAFYHADGNWGLDYDKKYTEIQHYFVSNDFDRTYNDNEHAINRNIEIKATSDYDYLTVYKSLLPGTLSADYSEYKYVAFTAKGSGLMELGLIKSSIEDWKKQYRVMVDLSEEETTYYVPFDYFSSTGSLAKMTTEDLTTLAFTFLPVEAQTTELDLFISDVKFTKTAVEDQIANKIEKFNNEFMAYPNPSEGNVNLLLFSETDTAATVTLSDITGKIIYRAKRELTAGKNELEFDFKVKTGVMLLQVTSPENNYGTSKIIFR